MRVTREIIATRPQGCALRCGMQILEGERIVSLDGIGWAHKRDVAVVGNEAEAMDQRLDRAPVTRSPITNSAEGHGFYVYVIPGIWDVKRRVMNQRLAGTGMEFLACHRITTWHEREVVTSLVFAHVVSRTASYSETMIRNALTQGLVTSADDVKIHLLHQTTYIEEPA